MSVDIRKYPSTQYRCDKVALRATWIKNVRFKIIRIRTGCHYVGYFYYSENLNWAAPNLQLSRGLDIAGLSFLSGCPINLLSVGEKHFRGFRLVVFLRRGVGLKADPICVGPGFTLLEKGRLMAMDARTASLILNWIGSRKFLTRNTQFSSLLLILCVEAKK